MNQFNNDSKEYLNVALNKIATLDALEQKANEIKESRGRERKPPAAAAGVLTGKAAEGAGGLDIINADIAQEIAELKSNAQILSEELKKKQLIVEELRELNKKRKQKSFVDMIASKLRSVTGITVSNFDAEYKKAIQDKKQSEAERKMMDNVIAAKEKKMAANNVKIEKDMTSSASAESSTAKAKEAVNAMFQSFTNSCQTTLGKIGALMTTQSSISSNKKRARPAGGRSIETRKKKIERFIKMTRKRIVHKTSNKKITRRVNKKARKQSHTHTHTRTHNRNKKETTTSRGYKKRTTHNKTIKRNTNNKRRHK